ncbi:hypothetical protein Q5P01_025485 [Channa striata]|uniref:LITAF domain-containing protein n=1 Tax=Channa striata TaxID=64152 RepID=A0AA88J5M2_CHASR|nr:hypothetical protein Q5P01_025485 [Channa striata]
MDSLPNVDESFPTPPPYILPDESQTGQNVRISHIRSPFSPLPFPLSFSLSPGMDCPAQARSSPTVSALPAPIPRPAFVSHETEMLRSPAITTCHSCQTQIVTQVTYKVGTFAWLMCLVFVLCGLVVGCCLIPFFLTHFKDAYHTCPCCHLVLHVHKKTCST